MSSRRADLLRVIGHACLQLAEMEDGQAESPPIAPPAPASSPRPAKRPQRRRLPSPPAPEDHAPVSEIASERANRLLRRHGVPR